MTTEYLGSGLEGAADVGLATGIAARSIAATVGAIRTSGYSVAGKGAGTYVNDALATSGLAAAHPRFCKQSLDGRYWRLALDGGVLDAMSGGALATGADDHAALQAAINYALTFNSATIRFPAGTYAVSASLEIVHGKGLNLIGSGPDNTTISAGAFPAMKTRGYWRSVVEGLAFWCNGNTTGGAFELEGEPDGSFGVQGISFRNCMFFGNYNSKYVFTNQRVAASFGQGSECSWINCAFQGSGTNSGDALFMQNGWNALQNVLLNCNFQGFITGVMLSAGAIDILHCGFQSTYGYQQIAQDGWDVDGSYGSVGDTITMTGCRTESLRIYRGGGAPARITGFGHVPAAAGNWGTGAKSLNALVVGLSVSGNRKIYRCTTAGTSGGTEPVWPESGTVADGTAVWTLLDFNVFQAVSGHISNGQILYGQIAQAHNCRVEDVIASRDDLFPSSDFISNGWGPQLRNVQAPASGNNAARPLKLGNNNNAGARNADPNATNFGSKTLVWTEGEYGGTYHDIAIKRAGGDYNYKVKNYFGVSGGWGFGQITFAELQTVTREGTVWFVTDGTPGTAPLEGSGTGCLAVWQDGVWQAVNLGAGLLASDGIGGVTLGSTPTAPAVTLNNSAGCTVTANSITCTAAAGWGSAGAYSTESYIGDVDLIATVREFTSSAFILALNSDPTTDDSYTSLDYGVYVVPGSPPQLQIIQSGSIVAAGPNIADGDQIAIRRLGTKIQYLHNRTVFHTTTGVSASTPLYLDSAFTTPGGVIENVSFGPGAFIQPSVVINGVIKSGQMTFAALGGLLPEAGDQIFVTDGTPGSSPLTGGGSGCLATYQAGQWRALAMGSGGGGLSDGDKGDITVSGSGASWAIDNGAVSLAKMADVATGTLLYRKTAGTGAPEMQTLATLKTDLDLTGMNSGDQTSIVGISGTKAQFNAACSDGDFVYSGDVTPYTDEMAQDAVGAMTGTSLVYVDGTPLLTRAALTGAITALQDSNATSLGSFTLTQLNTALSDAVVATGGGTATGINTGDQTIALTGDVAGSGTGSIAATIAAGAVSNTKLANVASATIKGRASAGAGVPEDLSGTQTTALLDTFTSALKGLAPASGGGTANFLRADGTWAAPGGGGSGAPGGNAGELQYNDAGAFAGAANVEIDNGNLKLVSTSDPAAPTAGIVAYAQSIAGRHMAMTRAPSGIAQALQGALHGSSVAMASPTGTAGAGVTTGALQTLGFTLTGTAASIALAQTFASANPWQATLRKRYVSAATAGASAGFRTAYTQWFRGSAPGFGGFFFRAKFGQNINLNGAQMFIGLCASTAVLATAAGAVSALVNMIGVGYDTTDASTGNWFLYRNDGSGTATKVDLGASEAARNTTHGYDLIIYCPPGAATEIFVQIVNIHTGNIVIDTGYTTDIPAVNTGLALKMECNNGAVASVVNPEFAKVYIESEY